MLLYKLSEFTERKFGMKVSKVDKPKSGYRNISYKITFKNGASTNFILFKREEGILERIQRANAVSDLLAIEGLEVRETINNYRKCKRIKNNSIIKLSNNSGIVRYGCYYKYLDGETIPWESYTSKHVKLLGGKMGELHRIIDKTNNLVTLQLPLEVDVQLKNFENMENYFSDECVLAALKNKLGLRTNFRFDLYRKLFEKLKEEDKQIIHMDFVRGNILFRADKGELKITGVLDFEKVAMGPRILDIARTLAFLLIDCKYLDEANVRAYFLHNGYKKRGNNPLPRLKYLEPLILHFLVYDFYKFLKHNPYEFLDKNEHFLRTKAYLIRKQMIKVK